MECGGINRQGALHFLWLLLKKHSLMCQGCCSCCFDIEEIPNRQAVLYETRCNRRRVPIHTPTYSMYRDDDDDDEGEGKCKVTPIAPRSSNKKWARPKEEGFNWHTGYNEAWAWVTGKSLAAARDASRHVTLRWDGFGCARGDTGPEPGAARESGEPSCHLSQPLLRGLSISSLLYRSVTEANCYCQPQRPRGC